MLCLQAKTRSSIESYTLDLYAQFCPILTNYKNKTIRKITEFFNQIISYRSMSLIRAISKWGMIVE